MKRIFNSLLLVSVVAFLLYACTKEEQRAVLTQGSAPTLTASSTTIVLDSSSSGSKTAITFNWPAVNYGADVATTYTLQIDSVNDNFAKPLNVIMGNSLSKSYTAADFNSLMDRFKLVPYVAGKIQVRVKADVNQSNGTASSVSSLYSNVLTLTVTPYSLEPQPLYPVPDSLYIVGDATPGVWDNPVPVPAQKFTKIDKNTFGIILPLTGGKHYLFLPKNGDWGHKYAVADNSVAASKTGTSFTVDNGQDIPAPDASGLYKIIVNFITGKYTVTAVAASDIPASLYLVGDATAGAWDNPVPVPSQQFTKTSAYTFEITVPLIGGKEYLFLPVNGSWDHKYASPNKTAAGAKLGGTFKYDGPDNFPGPDANGTYKIVVNFLTNTYTVTKM